MTESPAVAVIGLGLIGGSIARALAANGARVIAYDQNAASVAEAIEDRVVERDLGSKLEGLQEATTIIVALPGDSARRFVARLSPLETNATLVMDVGSTKQSIVTAAENAGIGSRFVGSHPLAGDHRSGWRSSRPDMFQGRQVFLCTTPSSTPHALEAAQDFWISLGAIPVRTDAAVHDSRMALVSHLPHVLSSALALTLNDASISRSDLGPGGRDMTRLAGSSPEMWTAIAQENASAITHAISLFEQHLSALKAAVESRDGDSFREEFTSGHEWFARQ
jgi:prephenate dehydrogenase